MKNSKQIQNKMYPNKFCSVHKLVKLWNQKIVKQSNDFNKSACLNVSNIRSTTSLWCNLSSFIYIWEKKHIQRVFLSPSAEVWQDVVESTWNQCSGLLKRDRPNHFNLRKDRKSGGAVQKQSWLRDFQSQNLRSRGASRMSGKAEDKDNPPRILWGQAL